MPLRIILFVFLLAIAAVGCTKDRVYENIYDGLQKRGEIINPSDEPIPPEPPSYDVYKKERAESLDNDTSDKKIP